MKKQKAPVARNSVATSLFRIALLFLICFFTAYYFNVKELIRLGKSGYFEVTDQSCWRGAVTVTVKRDDELYHLQYPGFHCSDKLVGQKVKLYYNEKFDYFYVPNTLGLYLGYIEMPVLMLFITFLPWGKWQRQLKVRK